MPQKTRAFHQSLYFRAVAHLMLIAAVVAAVPAFMASRSAMQIAERGVAERAAVVSDFVAVEAGGALKFGKTDALVDLFQKAIDTSDSAALGALAMTGNGDELAPVGDVPEALRSLAAQALETGASATGANGFQIAQPVVFGRDNAVAGVIAMNWSPAKALGEVAADQMNMLLVSLATFLAAGVLATLTLRAAFIRPLVGINAAMDRIAAADYGTRVPGTGRPDEIGSIAQTLEAFRDSLSEAARVTHDALFKGAGFQGSSAALMLADTRQKVVYANTAFEKLLNSAPHLGAGVPESVIGADIDVWGALPAHVRKAMDDPDALPVDCEIKVGESHLHVGINAVSDAEGSCIGYVIEWADVTAERRNEAVLDALDGALAKAEIAPDGRLLDANENFARLAAMKRASLAGHPCTELLASLGETGPVEVCLGDGTALTGRFRLKYGEGQEAVLDGSFTPMRGTGGRVAGHVFIGSDVTEAERAMAGAEARRKEMETAQARVVEMLRVNLSRLSEGDLTSVIDESFAEDYETLRADYNTAVSRLHDAMANVLENAGSISGESRHISKASEDLSRRTETQAATLEETVASIGQITNSVRRATEGALEANRVVTDARSNAESSGEVVQQAISAMGEIEASSNQISKIISVIDDIAFQTNLLALNAGVEAARAGEAGRGFAVVASEVRALAQRSSEAASEISTLISTSGEHVRKGVAMVGKAGQALSQIVVSVSDIAEHVGRIAASAEEQSTSLDEINTAMQQLDQVTQHNAAMFEETTATSQTLSREAANLNETLGRFTLDQATVPSPSVSLPPEQDTPETPVERTAPRFVAKPRRAAAGAAVGAEAPVEDGGWEEF